MIRLLTFIYGLLNISIGVGMFILFTHIEEWHRWITLLIAAFFWSSGWNKLDKSIETDINNIDNNEEGKIINHPWLKGKKCIVEIKRCTCSCHCGNDVHHVAPCCDNGYWKIYRVIN